MLEKLTYDTNVLIRYSRQLLDEPMYLSAVVVQELAAGAKDAELLARLRRWGDAYDERGRLLVPTGEDWWMAGKILWALRNGLRSHRFGRVGAISKKSSSALFEMC